jgi:hypothetical protein
VEDRTLGIIAGGGKFPLLVAEAAGRRGHRVVAVAHEGETDPLLGEKVDEIVWIRLGQLGRLIKAFKARGVRRALMAGTIRKRRMFEDARPDLRAIAVMTRLAVFHDDDILRALAREMEKEGIEIVSSTLCLPELLAAPGCLTRRRPSREETADIAFGWRIAKALGQLDIGQCVVVRRKTVLALEAVEGTDAAIRRGGQLAGEKAVVVKVSKPRQDLRFDVPSIGLETVRVMAEVKASTLAIEAGKTLLFDREATIAYADAQGIAIVSEEDQEEG